MLVEEYRQRFERPSTQDLTPFGPGMGGARRRRQRPRRPIGPFFVVLVGVVALLGALYLLGVVWGDPDENEVPPNTVATASPTATATATPRKSSASRKKKKAPPPRVVAAADRHRSGLRLPGRRHRRKVARRHPARGRQAHEVLPLTALPGELRQRQRAHDGQRQELPAPRTSAGRSATSSGRARSPRASPSRCAWDSAPHERPRGDHRHRHRGPVRADPGRQRAVAVGGAARARRRRLAHHRRGRPAGRSALARWTSWRDHRPDRHQRRARADRRRPDRRRRRGVGGRADGARSGAGGAHLGRRLAAAQADALRGGGDAGGGAQAGDGARRRDRAGAGRDRSGAARGLVAAGGRAARARRGSCRRCGRDAVTASPLRELLARAGTLEQRILRFFPLPEPQIAATLREIGEVPVRGHDLPAARGARGGDGVRAVAGGRVRRVRGRAARAARRRAVLRRRRDDRRGDRAAAGGADDRDRRVLHRRADGGPPDRPRGLLGLRAGRARRLLQRGQDGAGRACRRR